MKKTDFPSIYLPKCIILLFSLLSFCTACNQQSDEGASNNDVMDATSIEGVWELTNYYWVNYEWGDTLLPDPDEIGVQHKIYLDGYVMWTADPKSDSSEWHGYGTYRINNDTLIETVVKTDTTVYDTTVIYTVLTSNTVLYTTLNLSE